MKRETDKLKAHNFILHWLPLVLYCLLIFILSSRPLPEQIPDIDYFDKVLHLLAYGVMGILFLRAYATLSFRHKPQLLMALSIASASLYGIGDEIHQYFVPFREADILDGIADILGAAVGVYLYRRWQPGLGGHGDRTAERQRSENR